jgi:hypothetical protein
MKKYKIILTFLISIFYLLWVYFNYESLRKSRKAKLSDINLSVIDISKRHLLHSNDLYSSNFKLWDLEINQILEDRMKREESLRLKNLNSIININSTQQETSSNINLSKRKICVNEKCWVFMGMITINNKTQVTLLSTDKKPKLETFRIGDVLLEGLVVSKIKGDSMIVTHTKNNREFSLKLFDVDASAYVPKEIKVINE